MQRTKRYLTVILVVVCLLPSICVMRSGEAAVCLPEQSNYEIEKRACWISYIDIEENLTEKSEAAFQAD